MKMIFFLAAFCLVSFRIYFSWSGKDKERRGISESNMVIKSEDFYEEINYSGKFTISDDEHSFLSIAPGGFFTFKRNEEKVKAESNLQGKIEYTLSDGHQQFGLDEKGRELIREAIHEMIMWGYDPIGHFDRVYKKGGINALINETDSMRTDQVKILYLRRLLATDSLSSDEFTRTISKISSLGSDRARVDFLTQIPLSNFKNPALDSIYFEIAGEMGSDMDKINVLNRRLNGDSLTLKNSYAMLQIGNDIGSDRDKSELYNRFIEKNLVQGSLMDTLILQIAGMGSDPDKSKLYKKLCEKGGLSDSQWKLLIDQSLSIGSDADKADLLTEIGQKMPRTDVLKAVFLTAARTIGDDSQYGKVARMISK